MSDTIILLNINYIEIIRNLIWYVDTRLLSILKSNKL